MRTKGTKEEGTGKEKARVHVGVKSGTHPGHRKAVGGGHPTPMCAFGGQTQPGGQ